MKQDEYEDLSVEHQILKYTTYQIHGLIKKELNKISNINEFITKTGVSREQLDSLCKPCKIYSVEMYMAASKITGIPYDELTSVENINIEKKFRKRTKKVDDLIKKDMDFSSFLFNEIIFNAKLADKEE